MYSSPFIEQRKRSSRERTPNHFACTDVDERFIATVLGVKMRWHVVLPIHGDNDPKESANYGHGHILLGPGFSRKQDSRFI